MSTPGASSSLPAERAQALLRRLAVFAGSFTLEAAEAVAGAARPIEAPGSALWGQAPDHLPPGRPSPALVEELRALADRGLLLREDAPSGAPRYLLPEAVRAAGWDQLAAAGELTAAQRAHATYVLAFVEAIDRRVWTPEFPHWMARLEADAADLEAALAWTEEAGEPDLGLRLATALWLFWQTRGRVAEGRRWLERALARDGGSPRARAAALSVAGLLAWLQHDLDPAAAMLTEALARWRALDFPQGVARALFARALVAWGHGDGAHMVALIEEALALFRATDDLGGQPLCLVVLAIVARGMGDHERALALLEEAAGLSAFGGFTWGTAAARYYEGEVRADRGDLAGAAPCYRDGVRLAWGLGDRWTTGVGIGGVATLAALGGEATSAARLFGAADALCEAAGAFLPVLDRDAYARVVAAARATLGAEAFAAAYAAGRGLTPAQAIAEAEALVGEGRAAPRAKTGAAVRLTPRERDVLVLLVEGGEDAEIARALGLSPRTVAAYVLGLRRKLGLSNRTALAVWAVRQRLV